MVWGKKRQEIERLKNRIQQLENIICPHNSHEWVCTGCDVVDKIEMYKYTCAKCDRVEYDYSPPIIKQNRWPHKSMKEDEV